MMRPFGAVRSAVLFVLLVMVVYYKFGFESILDREQPTVVEENKPLATTLVELPIFSEAVSLSPGPTIFPSLGEQIEKPKESLPVIVEELANNATIVDPVAVVDSESLKEVKEAAEAVVAAEQVPVKEFHKEINGIKLKEPDPETLETEEPFEFMSGPPSTQYPPSNRPFVTLTGFKYCDMLEGATFFSDIELVLPGIKAPLDAGTAPELVKYIDDAAKQMPLHPDYRRNNFQRQTIVNKELNVDFLKRGICWNVAQGNLLWWKPYIRYGQDLDNKFNGRVLRTINAEAAFPFLNYDGNHSPKHELSITSKPSYKLAYVLMVHSNADNVAALINALADPTVFIYIHVDQGASEWFHEEIRKLVEGRTDIAIMPTPFAVAWAHVSLIWVELRAFFDLLDLIQFEYIINLSGTDYPLKSAKTIYEHLQKKPASNWLWWNAESKNAWELEYRMQNMFHCREWQAGTQWENRCSYPPQPHGLREFDGFKDLFPRLYKTSQWMILHSSAVSYLRSSEAGKLLLMHCEHSHIPDEMFFSTYFAASPFSGRTFRDPKRLMFWNGGSHPHEWNKLEKQVIESWADHFLWIRKVDVIGDPELKEFLDEVRRKDKMSSRIVLNYNGGIIPVD